MKKKKKLNERHFLLCSLPIFKLKTFDLFGVSFPISVRQLFWFISVDNISRSLIITTVRGKSRSNKQVAFNQPSEKRGRYVQAREKPLIRCAWGTF